MVMLDEVSWGPAGSPPVLSEVTWSPAVDQWHHVTFEDAELSAALCHLVAGAISPNGGTVTARGPVGLVPHRPTWSVPITGHHFVKHYRQTAVDSNRLDPAGLDQMLADMGWAADLDAKLNDVATSNMSRLLLALAFWADHPVVVVDNPWPALDADQHQVVHRWGTEHCEAGGTVITTAAADSVDGVAPASATRWQVTTTGLTPASSQG